MSAGRSMPARFATAMAASWVGISPWLCWMMLISVVRSGAMGSPSGGCRRRRTGSRGSSWRLSQGTPGHAGTAVEVVAGDAVVQGAAAVRVNALVELGEHLAQRRLPLADPLVGRRGHGRRDRLGDLVPRLLRAAALPLLHDLLRGQSAA